MLKLFKSLKTYKFSILLIVLFVFIQTISQLFLPTLMSDIIDKGITIDKEATMEEILNKIDSDESIEIPEISSMDPSKIDMSLLEKYNIDIKYKANVPYMLKLGGLMLLIALIGGIATIIGSYLSSKTAVGFSRDLRKKLFTKVESFSLHEFDKIGTASLITRTTNDITQIQNVIMVMLRMMLMAPIMFVGGTIMAVSKDAKLTLVLIVIIPILGLFIYFIARKAIPFFKIIQKKLDKVNLVLREKLTGIRVIRAFNRDDYENKRFDTANLDLTNTAIKVYKIVAVLEPVIMLGMNMVTVLIVWFGGFRIDSGNMQVGDLMALIQYVMQIMFSLIMVTAMFVLIPRASASADRINEVLEIEPEIFDRKRKSQTIHKKGYMEFKNVSFSYHGAEEPAIKNISFSASPGETTAIIGGTGSGKSTLINLIPRFYEVSSGSVLVDGVNVNDMTQESLRKKIGFVPQKAFLFTGTVEENIKFGKKDASFEEVSHAANIAQAVEFIENMENQFNSPVSQGGANFSGGQKQRLSIARALVRKPEIYIFDDSFSALDYKTDKKLRKALSKEIDESTVIIVAQRVSTVMNADRIIVLDKGEIAGIGTHKELIKTCSVYKEIVLSQLSEEELA